MILVYVPAGEFTMGNEVSFDERPVHIVNVDAFWIDQTEVTNAMYAKCVQAGLCNVPNIEMIFASTDYYGDPAYDNHPVIYATWNDAKTYCEWAGRRLPNEAEWEKAARGTDGRTYPWGEGINCNKANYNNCAQATTKVGSYPIGVSPYGALDMTGNVYEWVSSLGMPYPYDATNGREDLSASGDRVMRGGSWLTASDWSRSAFRIWFPPDEGNFGVGFRCALSP
jgi:formylglycine-generating enzyme required for sulfatase activity